MDLKFYLSTPILIMILPISVAFALVEFVSQKGFAIDDYNFVAAGDWGCTSNTDATVNNMVGKNPERVLGLGDYSYASTGTCWFNKIIPIDSITRIAIGNHEDDNNEGFSGYMSHFGLSQTYYSFNYQNTHFLVMDTDRNSYSSGSSQYNFVVNDLQAASQNPAIDWIVVYLHKFMYTSPSEEPAFTTLRNTYHPIFQQYGVDIVLQGHQHNYQRTFPIKYNPNSPSNPTRTSAATNDYPDTEGQIFALVGTGGQNFDPFTGKASYVVSQQAQKFGMLDIKITNDGFKLEGKFYTNDGSLFDQFTITKVNIVPVANNQVILTGKNTAKNILLSASDADNDPLSYSIVTNPQLGTVTGGTANSRIYTPTSGYTGSDSFTFRANDGTANSNTATVSISVVDPASCPANLPVGSVFASGNDGNNIPSNVLDNNLNTRWSNPGVSWIAGDLGSVKNICTVDIAWYLGNQRQYGYVIITSNDGNTWKDAFSGTDIEDQITIQLSSGTSANSQKYFIPPTSARFFGIVAVGVTNSLVGMTEVDIFSSSASLTVQYQYEPSLALSGPS